MVIVEIVVDADRPELLAREEFRRQVLGRDAGRCCVPSCINPAADAHHIVERALWPDGGYYLDNGAAVCTEHHLAAERTLLSPKLLREWSGITKLALPDQFPPDEQIDKWGNTVRPGGTRSPGPMFWQPQVQQLLRESGTLSLFDTQVKFPRILHLPGSPGLTAGDRVLRDLSGLQGCHLVVTEKMDGENTTFMSDICFARSPGSASHPSQGVVKTIWAGVCSDIPAGWRVCGENLRATHSVPYRELAGYFQVFAVFNEHGSCLSWSETEEWSGLLGLPTVPILWQGDNLDAACSVWAERAHTERSDGFVVRDAGTILPAMWSGKIAKWVRANHLQTQEVNWRHRDDFAVNQLACTADDTN